MDIPELQEAFEKSGYSFDADGLYRHFLDYGAHEGIIPNDHFDTEDYFQDKALHYFNVTRATDTQVEAMKQAFADSGLSAWEHYERYGWLEGINPSVRFDSDAYMEAKLQQLLAVYPHEDWTREKMYQAFADAGHTPLTHYFDHGMAENVRSYDSTGKNFAADGTFLLTTGADDLSGTDGNNLFFADEGRLQDTDRIDGKGGVDYLEAYLDGTGHEENTSLRPTSVNVEIFSLRALVPTLVDASGIEGMQQIHSNGSPATLVVEDIRINSVLLSVGWLNAPPVSDLHAPDFEAYFDTRYLKYGDSTSISTAHIEIMDVKTSEETQTHSLAMNTWDTLNFRIGGEEYSLTAASGYNGTIETFVQGLRDALLLPENQELSALIGIELEEETYTAYGGSSSFGQYSYSGGQRIVVNSYGGEIEITGWSSSPVAEGAGGSGVSVWNRLYSSYADTPLITTDIWLDNTGRVQWPDEYLGEYQSGLPDQAVFGTEAGHMIVGANGGRGGIERFDVRVDRGSWLSSLSSTNNALRAVTVTAMDIDGDGFATGGELFIGASAATNGAAHSALQSALLGTSGLTDLKYFDASTYEGNINIGAQLTPGSYHKFLGDIDGLKTMYADFDPDGSFVYTLGTNDDILNMTIDSGLVGDRDFLLYINGNDGGDLVNLAFAGDDPNLVISSAALRNVVINGGAGSDTIWTWGDGAATVNGGPGNDVIHVGQPADGSDTRTFSSSRVDGGSGNNVIVLNAGNRDGSPPTDLRVNDTLVISGEFGTNTVSNFICTGTDRNGTATALDKIDVTALLGLDAPYGRTPFSHTPGAENSAVVADISGFGGMWDWYNANTGPNAVGKTATAGQKAMLLAHAGTSLYTVYQILSDDSPELNHSEVKLIGTLAFDDHAGVFLTNENLAVTA